MSYEKEKYKHETKSEKNNHIILVKLQKFINNRKIRTKTILVYLFCVLLPVLVTNIIVIGNAIKVSHDDKMKNINNIADAVGHDVASAIENAVYVTVDLYTNNSLCNFLDDHYTSKREFYKRYNRVFENYVFYASSKQIISDITLYSDNSSMINGGRYYRIDAIRNEEWYQQFIQSKKDLLILPYYKDSNYINYKKRMISVIRKLNYTGLSNISKIVKLDLNYNKIKESVINSAFDTKFYICYENKIIFSNDDNDLDFKEEFKNISIIPSEEFQIKKTMNAYGFTFDIYIVGYKSNYTSKLKSKLWLITILFLADALIPAIIISLFSNSITKRVMLLGIYLKKVKKEEFEPIPEYEGKDEIGELLINYNRMVMRMKNLIENEYKSKLKEQELYLARQQAELLALHSQINPHFMFNVLESIRMRSVIKGEEETSQMIEGLARLLRKSAEWGDDLITLDREIEFTRDYVNLQKYRFGSNFNFKFRINKDCGSYLIPSLVLVSFVENSCVHGLNREGHSESIFISVYEESLYLYIEVEDTGIGMTEEQAINLERKLNEADIIDIQKSKSLGMLNACIRLKKYCGNSTKICIDSELHVGTCITIKIKTDHILKSIPL